MTAPVLPDAVTYVQDPRQPVSLTLDGHGLTHWDSQGCRWIVTSTRGWRGGGKPRNNRQARSSSSGSYRGRSYQDEKVIVLSGVCRAPTPAARAAAEQRIGELCPPGDLLAALVRVGEDGIRQTRYVELDDEIDPIPLNSRCYFGFDIQVVAPDPRKFGDWVSSQTPAQVVGAGGVNASAPGAAATAGLAAGTAPRLSDVLLANVGNAAYGPVLQVSVAEPTTTFGVLDPTTGRQLLYTGPPLEPGHDLWINCDDHPQTPPGMTFPLPGRAVLLDGTASRRAHISVWGGWPQVPPRTVGHRLLVDSATASPPLLTAHHRAASR